jgi:hypothetical protein
MTSQTITIRGTASDCWVVNRIGYDTPQVLWQTIEDDWFDVMDAYGVVAYSEAAFCPTVAYQFVWRGQPLAC